MTGQQCLFDDLIELQAGVVSRPQALAAGMSRNMVVVRLRSGRWQQLHWGVYATFSGKPGRLATLWAALLRGSPTGLRSATRQPRSLTGSSQKQRR